jgi:hypothetical protein
VYVYACVAVYLIYSSNVHTKLSKNRKTKINTLIPIVCHFIIVFHTTIETYHNIHAMHSFTLPFN